MDEEVLAAFVEKGLLPSKEVAHCRAPTLGKLFHDHGPTMLSPSSPSKSVGLDIPCTGSCVGSSMSGA